MSNRGSMLLASVVALKRALPAFALVAAISVATAAIAGGRSSAQSGSQEVKPQLPVGKQTALGLYVTAREAYALWGASPARVRILDVRTPEEVLFVGHAAMSWNVPLAYQTFEWDTVKGQFAMKPNPDFVSQVTNVAGPGDTLLVMCRSGGRSAMAVNQLAKAGFKYVYNITDGMEGDAVGDSSSVFLGQRLKNGWKNSGLPWTYEPSPDRMALPTGR